MSAQRGPGLSSAGNRVLLAVVLGLVVFVASRSVVGGAVIAVITYLIATAAARRS